VLVGVVPALGHAPGLTVTATTPTRGWVDVTVSGPPGVPMRLSEDGVAFAAGTKALAWRCEKRVRRIVAEATDGSGLRAETKVTTPSCAERFTLSVTPRTAGVLGRSLRVSVRDRWGLRGTAARACLRVRGTSACRETSLPGRVMLRPRRAGVGDLVVSGAGVRVSERLELRGRNTKLRVLATGDSMIQLIDHKLSDGLGARARVRSDARISTGISKAFMLNWVAHAKRQAASLHPHATIIFLGANDGFNIGDAACCEDAWVKAYAARVRAMMRSYRRGGAGKVYWLTIPTPRDGKRKHIYGQVNRAIRLAADAFAEDEVEVIDLGRIFTPGNRYRASINGRTVRQADGVHLNVAGAAIAAREIIRRLRADGLVYG
jgi:lysophospholipase L1-like esterase